MLAKWFCLKKSKNWYPAADEEHAPQHEKEHVKEEDILKRLHVAAHHRKDSEMFEKILAEVNSYDKRHDFRILFDMDDPTGKEPIAHVPLCYHEEWRAT